MIYPPKRKSKQQSWWLYAPKPSLLKGPLLGIRRAVEPLLKGFVGLADDADVHLSK